MAVIDNVINSISKGYSELINDEGFQTPLEIEGVCRRQAMKAVRYYGKQYPYALCVQDGVLRLNDTYISTTAWRPSTMKLQTDILNNEWEGLKNNFDTQN